MRISMWIFSLGLLAGLFAGGCKDQKDKACEHAYKMIKKCMPHLAGDKQRHLRVCQETFKKSSTKGTVECAKTFSQCEEFTVCLNYSARCSDFDGSKFKTCLSSAPMCGQYFGKKFKICITCVAEKHVSGEAIPPCVRDATGEKSHDGTKKAEPPVDMAPVPELAKPVTKDGPAAMGPASANPVEMKPDMAHETPAPMK